MLIRNRPSFITGMILTISFACVLLLIFAPVFGDGRNGLQYADDMFNRLSKGSSYFLPKITQHAEAMAGRTFKLELSLKSAPEAETAAAQYAAAGLAATADGQVIQLGGDLGKMLTVVLQDAEAGFRNDEEALQQRYGQPARDVLANWWKMMSRLDKSLKLEKRVPEAKAVTEVMKKGIEPAHNYFGIEAEEVSNMGSEMLGLLVFYVLYTAWWGYAILKIMEGLGLILRGH
jgi:hypothetical protein